MESALIMMMVLFSVFSLIMMTFWLHDVTVLTADLRWDLERCEHEAGRKTEIEPETGKRLLLADGDLSLEMESKKATGSWSGSGKGIWTGKTLSFSETVKKTYNTPGKYLYTNRLLKN